MDGLGGEDPFSKRVFPVSLSLKTSISFLDGEFFFFEPPLRRSPRALCASLGKSTEHPKNKAQKAFWKGSSSFFEPPLRRSPRALCASLGKSTEHPKKQSAKSFLEGGAGRPFLEKGLPAHYYYYNYTILLRILRRRNAEVFFEGA